VIESRATWIVSALFLFAGSFLALPWTKRRYIQYCFAFVAFSAFFTLGPRAAYVVLGAGAAGAIVQLVRARVRFVRAPMETLDRIAALLVAAVALSLAMFVTHAARTWLGAATYPLPFATSLDCARFLATLVFMYLVFTTTKEAALFVLPRHRHDADDAQQGVETSTSLYALGGIVAAPMQFAAYAVYARNAVISWACVMSWSFLVNAVVAREVARMRRIGELVRELGAKERMAAIGEVTARIVHQTRHQLGLIGISVHRIERRLASLSEADAAVVREELDKLGEVQLELRRMLTGDLKGEAMIERAEERDAQTERSSYAGIARAVAASLERLASSRGVCVEVQPGPASELLAPHDPKNVSHGLFNVLENAIVAARAGVRVDAEARGRELVVSVLDDGPGMDPQLLLRALEPFVTTKADGMGMGLAIARAAAAEEGGALRLANRDEGGLRVDFVFPLEGGAAP
jgi:signal transduction histidine kinase